MATASTNFVAQRFPTALSKKGLQHLAAISATTSPNSPLCSVQTLSCGRHRIWGERKTSSSKSIWEPAKLLRSKCDIDTYYCVEGRAILARVISARKNFRGVCASRRRNLSTKRLHSGGMDNSSVPFGASGTSSAPEGSPNATKLNSGAGAKEISGQLSTSAEPTTDTTNGTGDTVVADNGSAPENFSPDPKLVEIRKLFQENSVDAYIVPSEDAHQSEFMAESYLRRAYISGFTGSAGSVVITMDKAALWTDGRYFLQAESQLGPDWTLMRAGTVGVPTMSEWIRDNMPEGSRVGIDPYLFSSDTSEELKRTIGAKGHKLVLIYVTNLVDKVWGDGMPGPPTAPLRVHDIKFAGIDVPTKLANLRTELKSAGATSIVITALDEVAWLLNLRGNDVPHSPVTYAYVIVQLDSATLYVDQSKVTTEVEEHLANASVEVKSYGDLVSDVKSLAKNDAKLWLDPSKVSVAIIDAFNESCTQYYLDRKGGESHATDGEIVDQADGVTVDENSEQSGPAPIYRLSPVSLAKALKNAAELEGMKQAHLRDAAALAEFFSWMERKVVVEKESFTEVEVAESIDQFRAKQPGFLDISFETICGSGPNGAIVHYRAESKTCGEVNADKLLLLDSGGQYVDGTTDITRTVHFGFPTSRERECFTRVLQGHIAVDRAIFPESTPGFVLDVLARTSLWKIGLDYRHGTGHGVGAGLNVHEGPQGISSRFGNMTGLQAGMIVSNEPGYYEDRSFGIRVENLVYIREVETENRFGDVTFLGFDRLTFVPIQAKMLELSLLTSEEFKWLNDYHTEVWEKVSPLLKGDALEWLHRNTRPISPSSSAKSSEDLVTSTL